MSNIHPTAVIGKSVKLGKDVSIGAYCVLEGDIEIGDGVKLTSHVVVAGRTKIGAGTTVYPFASLGHAPQDLKYKNEPSQLIIGAHCVIREHVTMNPGTEGGGMLTQVGDHCLFMVGVHIAHDCKVGDYVIMANNATLAGHVTVGDHAVIGGLAAVLQFVRIGAHAMIGGLSGVEDDVIPYGTVVGERAALAGLNLVGIKRRGFDRDTIHGLRAAFRMLFNEKHDTLAGRLDKAAQEFSGNKAVEDLLAFVRMESKRALCRPKGALDVGE